MLVFIVFRAKAQIMVESQSHRIKNKVSECFVIMECLLPISEKPGP